MPHPLTGRHGTAAHTFTHIRRAGGLMRNIVLYAGSCPACSRVARLVTDASIAGLEARPFDDPQVSASLADAGLETPDRPALVVIGDTEALLLTGWAMRRRLAALVGWRRSGTIVRLRGAGWRGGAGGAGRGPGRPLR